LTLVQFEPARLSANAAWFLYSVGLEEPGDGSLLGLLFHQVGIGRATKALRRLFVLRRTSSFDRAKHEGYLMLAKSSRALRRPLRTCPAVE